MMVYGYCERCHRFRQVRVSVWISKGVPVGVCRDCEGRKRVGLR